MNNYITYPAFCQPKKRKTSLRVSAIVCENRRVKRQSCKKLHNCLDFLPLKLDCDAVLFVVCVAEVDVGGDIALLVAVEDGVDLYLLAYHVT